MTLQCTCGGAVELTDSSYSENYANEEYRCVSCGDTGRLTMGPEMNTKSGCLEENGRY